MDNYKFLLDANVFIEASRRYYAFDIAPGFWDNLIQHAKNKQLLSIDRVKQELERGNDDLAIWAKDNFYHYFVSTTNQQVVNCYRQIMFWVQTHEDFNDRAKEDFANSADGWLIAHAMVENCIVVTEEVFKPNVKRKVPIPNVCIEFNTQFVNTFEMLRQLQIIFK